MDNNEKRRRRVAMRNYLKNPLFAVEFMSVEFSEYDENQYHKDLQRKAAPARKKKHKKAKSPFSKFGRYPVMLQLLSHYLFTKDEKFLIDAQRMRNNISKPYLIKYANGVVYSFPPTYSVALIKTLSSIKYKDDKDLDFQIHELIKYESMGA